MEFKLSVHKTKPKHYCIIFVLVSIAFIYFNNPLATSKPLLLEQVDNCSGMKRVNLLVQSHIVHNDTG